MPRKLKTYVTSQGFFDLAIAAPSMKAALEAWGANSNLFHHGFAKETDDETIVAATLARPGVVLRRPVGSKKAFSEESDLPSFSSLSHGHASAPTPRSARAGANSRSKTHKPADDQAARKAALGYEKHRKAAEAKQRREEAAAEKDRLRRERAVHKAQTAFDAAQRLHEKNIQAIDVERAAIEARAETENDRWKKVRDRLEEAIRRARQ